MGISVGGSKSTTKQYQTYNTTTTTTSEVGDIGLTGANAVDLAAITVAGGAEITQLGAETVKVLSNNNSASYQQFLGASSHVAEQSYETQQSLIDNIFSFGGQLLDTFRGVTGESLAAGAQTSESALQTSRQVVTAERAGPTALIAQQLPLIALAAVAALFLFKKR